MLERGQEVYYARNLRGGVFDVCDLKVRTVEDTWFTAIDKRDNTVFYFPMKEIGESVFAYRQDALEKSDLMEEMYNENTSKVSR